VPPAKIGTEAVIRYAAVTPGTESQCRRCTLPLLFGRAPLNMLLPLRGPRLLLWLSCCRLGLLLPLLAPRLLLRLACCRLGWLLPLLALRLLLWLPYCRLGRLLLLLALRLLLWLPYCRLSLLLLRLRLCLLPLFRGVLILLVLVLLSVRVSKSSEKKEQNPRADNSNWFHVCCLQYGDFMHPSLAASGAVIVSVRCLRKTIRGSISQCRAYAALFFAPRRLFRLLRRPAIRADRVMRGSAISFLTPASINLPNCFFDFLLGMRSR